MTTPSVSERLTRLMARLDLDEPRAAEYLGVHVFTYRKWVSGERVPGAAVVRLLDIVGMLEAVAPAIHASLIPPASPLKTTKRGKKDTSPIIPKTPRSWCPEAET